MAAEMERASGALDFERAAIYRDRLAALSAIQAHQGINPRNVEEADVFAVHQEGGFFCVQVFFFRTGQNWGNRAYFPKADRSFGPGEVLGAFLAQFYDDKPVPRLVLISHEIEEQELLAQALAAKNDHKVEILLPRRGEKKELVDHALANAREALGRKLADTSSQRKLLAALAECLGLSRVPRRIEVYDNSHIQGTNAVGAMIVAGPEGFQKNQYRKFNIRSADLTPGDDFAMMREVLTRRFKRLIAEAPRQAIEVPQSLADILAMAPDNGGTPLDVGENSDAGDGDAEVASPWPDLVIIDGGRGQLTAAHETLTALGITDVPLVAIAKGAGPRRRPRDLLCAGARAVQAQAARPAALFHRAAARRGAPLRRRLAPRPPPPRYPRIRPAGNPRRRPRPQARAAAAFRDPESDRARRARRPGQSGGRQRRNRAQDLRFLPRQRRMRRPEGITPQ